MSNPIVSSDLPDIKIVMAGHVDHGKSTLLGRLLYETRSLSDETLAQLDKISSNDGEDHAFAYVLDHLAEERKFNITIDTTQVFFQAHGRRYVMIDAPGHKEFVRNMVTGAAQADAAILVVAANEGVCEQTRRHANLLALIGIKNIMVAVNKMDSVMYSQKVFNHICEELGQHLIKMGVVARVFTPISAQRGDNLTRRSGRMPWNMGNSLLEHLKTLRPAAGAKPVLAMPIQSLHKNGSAPKAMGRVESGTLKVGQNILVMPTGAKAQVKSIETFRGQVPQATSGWCVSVTIEPPLPLGRGMILADSEKALPAANSTRARVFWMSHQPLKVGQTFDIQCACQETRCTLREIAKRTDSSSLQTIEDASHAEFTDIVEAVLDFDKPLIQTKFNEMEELGRFTLSRENEVCAGGIVIG